MTSQQDTKSNPRQDTTDTETIRRELADERATAEARTADRLARLRSRQDAIRKERRIRQGALREKAADRLRKAKAAADVRGTAESRALRVSRTRALSLLVLLPVLAAFGIWSTAGVHAGVTAMTGTPENTPMWWALWLLEPALITAVGWIILCRSWLSTSGGALGEQADKIMAGALGVSIVLNAIGHWPDALSWQGVGGLVAHSLGPIGAATTAHLIGLIETAVTKAKPTEGAPLLDDLDIAGEHPSEGEKGAAEDTPQTTVESTPAVPEMGRSRLPERALEVPAGAVQLPVVRCSSPSPGKKAPAAIEAAPERPAESGRRSVPEQGKQRVSEAPAKTRSDKGRKLPRAATPSAAEQPVRALSDADLLDRLAAMITAGELPEGASVRRVQTALGCGFERAKRVLSMREESTETVTEPTRLTAVHTPAEEKENAA
ncbi:MULTISPECIES: hypothetical protein [Nocardiopsidaceae]|uniref:DUF2637 domain-containing protein n=1 Tax=Streptomonospora nanhaiensis TaxID=1323731 RepID=A0ABY6YL56_9ACTN|nr:hypothetical protein [Streptomonospora nanhaiensis]WAE72939.1 hypothetical protein OUQ99_27850 [Streptomonospora nanhaiensis]